MNHRTRQNPHSVSRAFPSGVDDLAQALMQSGLVPFALVDSGNIVAASPPLRELLGGTSPYHHIDGQGLLSVVAEADRGAVAGFCAGLLRNPARADLRCSLLHASGQSVPVLLSGATIRADDAPQIVLLVTDLTAWTGAGAASALGGAFDAATGFPRLALLLDRMRIALAAARRHRRRAAVLCIELEHFEPLLQALAPAVAEEIEATVAETLRNCVRDSDTVARLGRARFALLLSEISERDDAGVTAARVVAAIAGLFAHNEPARRIHAHIGVCAYPTDGINAERLLQGAETALVQARRLADGGFVLADASIAELAAIEPLELRDEHLVGVNEIDEDHRTLVARTNAVVRNLKAGVAPAQLARDVRGIAELLRAHFATESRHLGTSPYEGAIDIKSRNRRFLDELDCILLHVNAQSILLAVRHLHDWLIPHLQAPQAQRAS